MQNEQLNSYRDLENRGYGKRTTIWRKVRRGEFPKPIDIGNGQPRWRESDLTKWLKSRPWAA